MKLRHALLSLLAFACFVAIDATPANAQYNGIEPALRRLTGGLLWGSIGYRDIDNPSRLEMFGPHPALRGGFAALYGPFGGQPDTTVQIDSVRTTVALVGHSGDANAVATPADTNRSARSTRTLSASPNGTSWGAVVVGDTIRTQREMRSHYTIPGRQGWISIAVGYEYSSSYRVNLHGSKGELTSVFPVGGVYAGAYFGPFPVRHAPENLYWVAGMGASYINLNGANGMSDSTLVRFDTEHALSPEVQLLLGWRFPRGLHTLVGIGLQEIGWSSIHYRQPSDLPLSDDVVRRLPRELRLTVTHLIIGISYDTNDLFRR